MKTDTGINRFDDLFTCAEFQQKFLPNFPRNPIKSQTDTDADVITLASAKVTS